MIYYSRNLYNGVQDGSGWSRRALKRWEIINVVYGKHLKAISKYIPANWLKIFDGSLHDSVVTNVKIKNNEIWIGLDCRGIWGQFGGMKITLHFKNVIKCDVSGLKRGDWWLYNEIHLGTQGKARICVLFQDSEIDIESDQCRIEVQRSRSNKTPKRSQ